MGIWGDRTLAEIFDEKAIGAPGKTAVVDDHVRWTYGELQDQTLRAAQFLLENGVRPGDAVAVQLPSCALLPLVHLAANRIGALMVAMPTRWRASEVGGLLAAVGARVMIAVESEGTEDLRAMHESLRPTLPGLKTVHYARIGTVESFEQLVAATDTVSPEHQASLRPDPDGPAHIMCSSGTTGVPKASVWGGNDMVAFLLHQTKTALALSADDIATGIAPAGQASTGYVFPILAPLLMGATSVILERWTPAAALDLIVREHATYATAIPTQMVMLLEQPLESLDLSAFTRFNNAGAPLPPHVATEIERRMGCRVQSVYGTTDGGVPTMTAIDDPDEARWNTVGRVCVGEEIELRDADGQPVAAGETGEVCWRGANNSYGYFNQPDYDDATWLDDGWCRSGDLGRFDDAGCLRIVGRIKDMILRGGMNIFPVEIEEALVHHPRVRTAAVVPVPDPRLGERACVAVVPEGDAPTLESLTAFLTDKGMAKYKLPEFLVLLDDLPTNPGGKVDKARLNELVTAELGDRVNATDTNTAHSYTDIEYAVADAVATITINRPERLNAFTIHTLGEMTHAVATAGKDDGVGVIVITGAGDRAFCAGGDVNIENEETFSGSEHAAAFDEVVKVLYEQIRDCLKPVIARVNGYAIGGGNHLAYVCDFTIAADKSVFGQNGPRVASPAEGWLVSYLWTVVGIKRAKEMWMLCRRYSAQQALDWGLVNAVVAEEELDDEVRRWADELLALSPTVLKLVKRSFDDSFAAVREAQDRVRILDEVNPAFFCSGEQAEGAEAFLQRRRPDFSAFR